MSDESDALAHPDLGPVGAAMRAEWRAEQDAAARDAAEHWQQRRTLHDRLVEHQHRGDRIAVTVAGHRVAGVPEMVGADVLALRTCAGVVDVHLCDTVPMWFEVLETATAAGIAPGRSEARFRDRLLGRSTSADLTTGTVFDPDGLDGRLVVGADHVVIVAAAGAQAVVPLAHVAWVGARSR
jgi:hypothetical protein